MNNRMDTIPIPTTSTETTNATTTSTPTSNNSTNLKIALVIGANNEQGRAVIEGLVDSGQYNTVYAMLNENDVTHSMDHHHHHHHHSTDSNCSSIDHHINVQQYFTDGLGATIIYGNIENQNDIKNVFTKTNANYIFIITTTQLPTTIPNDNHSTITGYQKAADEEYETIVNLFHILVDLYKDDTTVLRHVILSVRDDVQTVAEQVYATTNEVWIQPLNDGSIVPHFTAKGRGGKYALQYIHDHVMNGNITITLITIPFLYSNFLSFFTPLPDETRTQWLLTGCFGDGNKNKIDMMSTSDLSIIIPNIFENPYKYNGQNLRLVGEQLSMDEIAFEFSDLFGKDVIYNPLTVDEVAQLPFASAPCMAQMCQFLGDPRSLKHDIEITKEVCFPKHPQTFRDWLLSHSESNAFQMVGLDVDAPDILNVTVFGATSPEGRAVVKGLLADVRKQYKIRATTRHIESDAAKEVKGYDPDRVEIVYADFDDFISCQAAVEGVEGAFLVTDFYEDAQQNMDVEERHARNVIDACEASSTMKHLVFSTMESMENMARLMKESHQHDRKSTLNDDDNDDDLVVANKFDAKARAAAYARTKRLSVTYVLMPCYTQHFFDMIERRPADENGNDKFVLTVPLKDDQKVMCMNIDDLGPAVANIFDSYQVYAGREVGLVTDFISVADVRNIIEDVFLQDDNVNVVLETEETSTEQWLEVKDTYMKDLGQMFVYMSHTDEVKMRHSIAKTMKLVPSARPLRQWIEQNVDNVAFREKLGLR